VTISVEALYSVALKIRKNGARYEKTLVKISSGIAVWKPICLMWMFFSANISSSLMSILDSADMMFVISAISRELESTISKQELLL